MQQQLQRKLSENVKDNTKKKPQEEDSFKDGEVQLVRICGLV